MIFNFVTLKVMINFDKTIEIPVMEHFYTIQGEGYYSGRPAYFIRLAGCDVGCHWCDVKESWATSEEQLIPILKLKNIVKSLAVELVVITGGEPSMYDLTFLIKSLKTISCQIAIETSGVNPVSDLIDWYCFSPKKFKKPIPESFSKANELKIVINHKSDFEWAEEHAKKVKSFCKLFLQPEWSNFEKNKNLILNYVKSNNKWRISLQTHKFMNIP